MPTKPGTGRGLGKTTSVPNTGCIPPRLIVQVVNSSTECREWKGRDLATALDISKPPGFDGPKKGAGTGNKGKSQKHLHPYAVLIPAARKIDEPPHDFLSVHNSDTYFELKNFFTTVCNFSPSFVVNPWHLDAFLETRSSPRWLDKSVYSWSCQKKIWKQLFKIPREIFLKSK